MKIRDSSVHVNNMKAKLKWSVWNSVVICLKWARITYETYFSYPLQIYIGIESQPFDVQWFVSCEAIFSVIPI